MSRSEEESLLKHESPVWFITGCSSGLGRALSQVVIDRGWRLVATAREKSRLTELVHAAGGRAIALDLDVTKQSEIDAAVSAAQDRFGRIDVLVNNAGYGYQSTAEEGTEHEIRAQFETNVFGLFTLTRAVLPLMRKQRSGNIINITSVAGLIGFPGSGYYAASKHAVEGWSDSLRAEVGLLGINVTCVEPGPFRTDWAGRSLKQTPNRILDYAETAGKRLIATKETSGTQVGDPVRAGEAMIALVQKANPPRHLVLGKWGFETVTAMLQKTLDDVMLQREHSLSADFPSS
jgi:NAD(P)-dependent dehydrogenase (short-subunit alcohol dehydrogenase family)